jgi:hypothetical protein
MSENLDKVVTAAEKTQKQAAGVVEKLFDVARPSSVYGEPITAGDHTVITASEVSVGMGIGLGIGGGEGRGGPTAGMSEEERWWTRPRSPSPSSPRWAPCSLCGAECAEASGW